MSGQTWQFARAGTADLDAIMGLETATFAHDAWSPESMRAELASEHCYYLVAFEPDHPELLDGYAGLLAPAGSDDADIQTLAVAERARRRGLGRALVLQLIAEARKRHVKHVFLEVRADNPAARSLYEQLGFVALGVRRGYYQPDNVDAIVMRLPVPAAEAALAAREGTRNGGGS